MPRLRKRAKIAESFLDLQAQDSGCCESDEDLSDDDLEGFILENEYEGEEDTTVDTSVDAALANVAAEDLDEVARRFREKARHRRRILVDHNNAEFSIQSKGRIRTFPLDNADTEGSVSWDASGASAMKLYFLPTKIGQEVQIGRNMESRTTAPSKVLASSSLLGRIYILSPNKTAAQSEVRRMSHLDPATLEPVPTEDSAIVLRCIKIQGVGHGLYAPRHWVRLRNGLFKDKLGYVLNVKAMDLLRIAIITGELKDDERGVVRNSNRVLDAEKYLQNGKEIPWCFDNDDIWPPIQKKYLSPSVTILNVYGIHATKHDEPHASEIEVFTRLGFDTRRTTNRSLLQKGDHVRVINGDLGGTNGVVHEITGNLVKLQPSASDFDSSVPHILVSIGDMERIFEAGRAIIVKIGEHAGRSGYVVSSIGEDLVVLDRSAQNEFVVRKAFVQTCSSTDDVTRYLSYKRGAIKGHLVHIIELGIVGRILNVTRDGNVELDIPTTKGRQNMIFRPSEVVDTESYQCLDGSQFNDTHGVDLALSRYVDRRSLHGTNVVKNNSESMGRTPCAVSSSSYVDPTSAKNQCLDSFPPPKTTLADVDINFRVVRQDVYVLKNVKKFGHLVALNGKSHAIVLLDGELQPKAFPLNEVLSLRTLLCMDNSVAQNIDDIFDVSFRRNGQSKHKGGLDQLSVIQHEHQAPTCSWFLQSSIQELLRKHRIFFRFIDSCVSPGNVARMPAWTTVETSVRFADEAKSANNIEIYLSFKTRDAKEYTAWVLLSNVLNLLPKTVDNALIVSGPDVGRILPVKRMEKGNKGMAAGILLRASGSGRTKKLVRYELSDVTKIQTL